MGGVERLAVELAIAEQRQGHAASIQCVFEEGALAVSARQAGIQVHAFRKKRGPSVSTFFRLIETLREVAPEVVHTHNSGIHHYYALAARIAGVPVVVNTRHSPLVPEHMKRERHYRWAMHLTDCVVFVSEATRKAVLDAMRLPQLSSQVILNGIPTSVFHGRAASPGAFRPCITFGTVGRLEAVKGHAVLIEAFAEVARAIPQARLRIVGGGSLANRLQELIRLHQLQEVVSLESATAAPHLLYREFDVFVLSSLSEGLPLVLLESMAAGLPVVSTRVGGIPDVVTDNIGFLCEPDDPHSLADAMMRAAAAPDLDRRGAWAERVATEEFDIAVMCSQYINLFERLLSKS
jgi:glycosyltransferase involved in cell wall biosynthesis